MYHRTFRKALGRRLTPVFKQKKPGTRPGSSISFTSIIIGLTNRPSLHFRQRSEGACQRLRNMPDTALIGLRHLSVPRKKNPLIFC